ncbi:MAG: hypothetical protein HC874_14135 [Richelia sp. SL_2_1]|nr:hypothetical protein [Richelia sp. SL_2_1]
MPKQNEVMDESQLAEFLQTYRDLSFQVALTINLEDFICLLMSGASIRNTFFSPMSCRAALNILRDLHADPKIKELPEYDKLKALLYSIGILAAENISADI